MKQYKVDGFTFWAKTKPFSHQKIAVKNTVEYVEKHGGYCLFSDAGTGKTKIVLDFLRHRAIEDKSRYFIVIAPKTLLPSWVSEIEKHSKMNEAIQVLLEGSTLEKGGEMLGHILSGGYMTIMNYAPFTRLFYAEPGEESSFLKKLIRFAETAGKKLDTIIVDESSRCRNTETKFWQALYKTKSETECNVVLLNATPIEQGLEQIWPQFRVAYKEDPFRCNNYRRFLYEYFYTKYGGKVALSPYKKDEYQRILNEYSFRVSLDSIRDMPDRVFVEHEIDLDARASHYYRELAENFAMAIQSEDGLREYSASAFVAIIEKLLQICTGIVNTSRSGEKPNYIYTEIEERRHELITELVKGNAGQTVVFCRHKINGRRLYQYLIEHGIPAELISILDGDTDNVSREAAWRGLDSGKYKVGLFQITAGGQGINLPNVKNMIFSELWWSARLYKQALGRNLRLDSDNKRIKVDIITAKNTVESKMLDRLKGKIEDADEFLDKLVEFVFGADSVVAIERQFKKLLRSLQ